MSGMVFVLGAIAVYLIGMLLIGVAYSKNSSSEDFYLGGRRLGPVVTAMSTEASDMSAYLLMGVPGLAMFCGVAEASWTAIGLAAGTYLNWLIVARRLRRYSAVTGSITVPEFLSRRFRDSSRVIETVGALVIIIFFVPYTASGFAACGKLFNSLFGFDYETAMLLSAAVIVAYCALGGFMAASVTSLIQSIVMTAALVIVLFFGAKAAGGWGAVMDNARSVPGYLSLAASTNILSASAGRYTPLMVVSTLAWGLGYFGMPHILVRFMAIRKPSEIKKSATIAIIWVTISLAASLIIAYLGRMIVAGELLPDGLQATVFIHLARRFFPPFLSGILLAAIIAASMSTADSQLLVASSSFTNDIYKPLIRKNASDKELVWVARGVVAVVAIIAYFLASARGEGAQAIMDMVENAWGLFGSAFGPVVLLSVFWKRFNYWGAVAGVVGGAVTDILWYNLLSSTTGVYELFPGFVVGMLCAVVVTLLTKAPSAEVVAIFDKATDPENDE